jgi:hypothetical protein
MISAVIPGRAAGANPETILNAWFEMQTTLTWISGSPLRGAPE